MKSPTATQTCLLGVPANLPIVSVVTDPDNLWNPRSGIYTKGSNGIKNCNVTANWHQSWERPASIEFYETDGTNRLNQEVGLEIFGNCTRNFARKSFEIKAKKLYGDNDMDYAFFDDKPMTSYKRLILRNAGQDHANALMRDALSAELVSGRMDIDRMAYRPAVVYLNGVYWGVYDLRQRNASSNDPAWAAAHPGDVALYGICWFDPAAVESISRARYCAWLIEEGGLPVRVLRWAPRKEVIWRDAHQIVVKPTPGLPRAFG